MTVANGYGPDLLKLGGQGLGPFQTTFQFQQTSDVVVQLDIGDGNGMRTLVMGPDYVVVAPSPLANGGAVILASYLQTGGAWASNALLQLSRFTPREQPSAFGELAGFSPSACEAAIDYLAYILQELAATELATDLSNIAPAAGKVIGALAIANGAADVNFDNITPAGELAAAVAAINNGAADINIDNVTNAGQAKIGKIAVANGAASTSLTNTLGTKIVLATSFGVVADCTGVGVGTDNTLTLQSAIEAWVAAGDGALLILPPGRMRVSANVTANLNGQRHMAIEGWGSITPDAVSARTFAFLNGTSLRIKLRFLEGGPFNGWNAANPYPVNYTTTQEVLPGGGAEAVFIQGVFGVDLDLEAVNYAGRLLRTTQPVVAGWPQTGGLKGTIWTTRDYNGAADGVKPRVGQALYADCGSFTGQGDWGHLSRLINDFDAYGPVWDNLNDIAIDYIDGAYHYSGVQLNGCVEVHGGTWYIGDIDGAPSNHVSLGPGSTAYQPANAAARLGGSFKVGRISGLDVGEGVYLQTDPTLVGEIGVVDTNDGTSTDTVLEINGGAHIRARVTSKGANSLVYVHGAAVDDIQLSVSGESISGNQVLIGPDVVGSVTVVGALKNPAAGYSCVDVQTQTGCVLLDKLFMTVPSNNGLSLPAVNNVRFLSGGLTVSGGGTTWTNAPKYVAPAAITGLS